MATLILRADQGQEQHHIPCHVHALSVLRRARAAGMEWIRVEKPGHACDFMVAALVQQVRENPLTTPKCLVHMSAAQQDALGAHVEERRPVWPSVALVDSRARQRQPAPVSLQPDGRKEHSRG